MSRWDSGHSRLPGFRPEGVVDLTPHLSFRGVFEPPRDPAYCAQVRVDPQLGIVVWPNGADLDPDVLYGRITGSRCNLV